MVSGSTTTGRTRRTIGIRRTRFCSVSARASFPRLFEVAVFLYGICKALLPAAEHLSRLIELQSQFLALSVRKQFPFPRNGDEELEDIQREDAIRDLRSFLLLFAEVCRVRLLQQIKKRILNSGADRVPCALGNMRSDPNPYQVSLFDSLNDRGALRERERERERMGAVSSLRAYHFDRESARGVAGVLAR